MPNPPRNRRRLMLRLLAASVALLIADQIVQFAALGDGWLLGRRIAPFDPPLFMASQYDTLDRLARDAGSGPRLGDVDFDAELGWCTPPPGDNAPQVDWCGGRAGRNPVPEQKGEGVTRIAAFGCSFTYGSEVDGVDAWPAQLDELRPDLEILNFGVPGYGPDQALLRFRRVIGRTQADEVWLGVLPATVLRLVSMYRPALRHYTNTVAFKPRFQLSASGELTPVSHPAKSVDEVVAIVRDPGRFAEVARADSVMNRYPAAYAKHGESFAHYFASTRLLLTVLERGGRDWVAQLRDEKSESRRLMRAIFIAMSREAKANGARFRVVILGDPGSIADLHENVPWRPLQLDLADESIEVLDPSATLARALRDGREDLWAPNGHYSAAGNRLVAESLAEQLGR